MDGLDVERLLGLALELAGSMGASYAEARYHALHGHQAGLMDGRVFAAGYEETVGLAVRVIVDGGLGFSATNRLTREGVEEAVRRAVAGARLASGMLRRPVRMAPGRLGRAKYSVSERRPLESLGLEEKLGMLRERVGAAGLEGLGIEIRRLTVFYQELRERKVLATMNGGYIESYVPRVLVGYNITASSGGSVRNRLGMLGWSGGLEGLDEEDLTGSLEDDARSLAVALTRAGRIEPGRMDVVLSPELTGIAVHESIGHPSEADRVLGREAAQAGLSYWSELELGDRLGSEHVTVVDDPTVPGSFGFYLYDDEAVPARPRFLLLEGRVREMLHNRETGAVYGVGSNGAARARDYKSEPIVRMANTFVQPGDHSLEELVEGVRSGVYIRKYMEWNIDDYRWAARYVGLEAYRIRNGRLEEPVRDVVLEITSPEFWGSIDAVGRDLRLYPGFCGKGEPMQAIPVTMGGPSIRLRGVMVR